MVLGAAAGGAVHIGDSLNRLRRSIEEAGDRLQRASLALGKTFDQMNAEITPAMDGLRGSLDQRIGAALAGLNAGLQGNTAGVAKLINQQQLTGTAFQNTAVTMAQLSQGLNVTTEEVNNLSLDLIETGGLYSVSTDKLVNAVQALKDTFPVQQLAGMGTEVNAAVASLTAQMPAMASEVTSVMKMILDPSLKTEANLARLGISGVRERLAAAKDQKQAEQILKNAISTASNTISQFVSGDFFASIGIATDLFGENASKMTAINAQLGKRIQNEEQAMNFGDTIKAIRDSMLVPLQRVLQTDFYPAIKQISKVLSGVGERFAGALSKWISKLDFSEKYVFGFTDALVGGAISLTTGLESVINFMIDLSNDTLPLLKAGFGKLILWINNLPIIGGFLEPQDLVTRMDFERIKAKHGLMNIADRVTELGLEKLNKMGTPEFGTTARVDFTLLRESLGDLKSNSDVELDLSRRRTKAVEEMNEKTLDPFETTADTFMLGSAQRIQSFMGAILGQTPADQLEETNNILGAILMSSERSGLVPLTLGED